MINGTVYLWLAGGSPWHNRRGFTAVADNAVYSAGSMVLCSLIATIPPVVALPLMVWQLSAPLAALSGNAAGRKTSGNRADFTDFRCLSVAGQHALGTPAAARHSLRVTHFYVADPGG